MASPLATVVNIKADIVVLARLLDNLINSRADVMAMIGSLASLVGSRVKLAMMVILFPVRAAGHATCQP